MAGWASRFTSALGRAGQAGARASFLTIQGCLLGLALNQNVVSVSPSYGPSMLPTLHVVGDFVVYDRYSHKIGNIRVGDIVVCICPSDPNRAICKRVLGMPGDQICIDPRDPGSKVIEIPPGHVWLQGDNMKHSVDSRYYGPIPMGLLQGKVRASIFPEFRVFSGGLEPVGKL
ncbi:hypothetical protein H4R35_004933 [Dimargaris xerosporica]|nr:hypothetical protein H4R35_004933 [Dimargaris xerosporica]